MAAPRRQHLARNNEVLTGLSQMTPAAALTTADEVEIVVSGDPGATGVTLRLTFFGIQAA